MNKLLIIITAFLILGLYVDINVTDLCNGPYNQQVLRVMTVVPFRSPREKFFFGIGRKHWDYSVEFSKWNNPGTGKPEIYKHEGGCAADQYLFKEGYQPYWNSETRHYLDLRFF